MGYASFLEDIVNKLSDMSSMIDKSSRTTTTKVLQKEKRQLSTEEIEEMYESLKYTKRELVASKSKLNKTELESKNTSNKLKRTQELVSALQQENETLKFQLQEKESLLRQLQKEIFNILEKNEIARRIAENRNREILDSTVNKVTDENAEIILKLKSGILQIGSIINQQYFYKKAENINTIKLLIKKLTGLA